MVDTPAIQVTDMIGSDNVKQRFSQVTMPVCQEISSDPEYTFSPEMAKTIQSLANFNHACNDAQTVNTSEEYHHG